MRNRHLERRLTKERIQDGFILPEVYSKYREMVDVSFPHLNEEQKDAETRIICHTHPDSPHVQTPTPDPKLQPAKRDAKLLPVLVGGLLIMGQIIALLLAVLIYLVLFSDKAHAAGTSQIDVIKVTDGTTTLVAAAPFKISFSGCTVGGTGSAWTITCSGAAANPGGTNHQIEFNANGVFGGIPAGTAGQVLCSNGTTSDPAMCDPVVSGPDAVGAASTKPPVQIGCVFLTTPATLTNNQVGALQCDSVQNLLVKVINSLTVSGSVTANAGTNLNTSLLALEAGGNLAAIKTDVDKIPTSPATDRTTAAAPFAFELSDGAAFYTSTKTGQLPAALDGSGFLKTHEQGALPAGTNVIGHVIADSGSTTVVTGNVAVTKADGSDVTLGAKADAKSTATDTTAVSMMQVLKEISAMVQAPASTPVTGTFFQTTQPVAGTLSDNNAAPSTTNVGAMPCMARTDLRAGTAATAGRIIYPDCGTDGLVHVAALPDSSLKRFAASSKFAASSTTDNWRISGNASNTVILTDLSVTCTQTTAGQVSVVVRKESAAVSGGTAATVTNFPVDSNKAAASSVVQSFTGTGPTVGTLVGDLDDSQFGCMASATATPNDIYIYPHAPGAPIAVLRGTAEGVALNFGGAITGGNLTVKANWVEVTTITP